MRITRLGQGVDAHRPARPRGHRAHGRRCCASTARSWTATASTRVRMTATSAARDAANRDEFFAAAEAAVGVRPELLSGRRGGPRCRSSAPPPSSTRPTARSSSSTSAAAPPSSRSARPRPRPPISLDMGCVRITEQFLHSDPPAPEELSHGLSVVELHLDDVAPGDPRGRRGGAPSSGLAGTVSTDRRRRARPGRVRPRPHPPLPAHQGARSRTCSARSPPSRSPTACTTRASSRSGPTSSSAGCACSCRSCAGSASASAWCREADILDGLDQRARSPPRRERTRGRPSLRCPSCRSPPVAGRASLGSPA